MALRLWIDGLPDWMDVVDSLVVRQNLHFVVLISLVTHSKLWNESNPSEAIHLYLETEYNKTSYVDSIMVSS